jgi:hypothetical protein
MYRPAVDALEDRRTQSVTFAERQTFSVGMEVLLWPWGTSMATADPTSQLSSTSVAPGLLNTTAPGTAMPIFAAQDVRGW